MRDSTQIPVYVHLNLVVLVTTNKNTPINNLMHRLYTYIIRPLDLRVVDLVLIKFTFCSSELCSDDNLI